MENTSSFDYPVPPPFVLEAILNGLAIPAHPLALTSARRFNERRQRALTRYYLDAGAGGLAVGVHSTQFEIHHPHVGLYNPVLELAAQTITEWEAVNDRKIVRIAGIVGDTPQAVQEAQTARSFGYHAGLLSLGALSTVSDEALIQHAQLVAREIPLFGFYLQPAVGGRRLSYAFWRVFADIPNLIAIKIAPFNRYQTLDVVRAVAESDRSAEIALYTGNDDHIVLDLLSEYIFEIDGRDKRIGIRGGLLGHWSCWTKGAMEIFGLCKQARGESHIPQDLLRLAGKVTDANAAFFDSANNFKGALCGIHEVLRRQGLLENIYCLDDRLGLSPGQLDEIDRVYRAYPDLNDDEFVHQHLDRWLA
jgi:dihydrodipicolinate synthase/N-acetylneuraminate lyase